MSNKFLTVIYDMSRPGMQQKASLLLLEADWTASGWSHAFADRDEARKELYRLQESISAAPQVVADERAAFHAAFLKWNGFHTEAELDEEWSSGLSGTMFREGMAAPVQAQEPVAWRRMAKHAWEYRTSPPTEKMKGQGWLPLADAAPVQPVAVPDCWKPTSEIRTVLRDSLASGLTMAYGCSRVWSAWSVGTMSQDDFYPASECDELLDELCDLAIAALRPDIAAPAAQGDKK